MSSVTFAADAEGTGPLLALRLPLRRVLAIDAFRGLTILAMIFVNTLEDVQGMPSWLYHTPENSDGLTFPDLVFPAFLFIVGMSIPFATAQRLAAGDTVWRLLRHVLMRTLGLLVLGVFMVNAEEGYNERAMPLSIGLWSLLFYISALMVWGVYQFQNKALAAALRMAGVAGLVALALLFRGGDDGSVRLSPQWWGILGLIGWSYLFASAMYLLGRGRVMPLMIGLFLWLIYYCLAQMDAVQASPVLQLLAGQSENAVHISIVLCGVMTTLFFFDASGEGTPQRFGSAALFGAGASRPWSSVSAVLWSIQDLGHAKLGALQRGPMRRAVCFSLLADRPQRGAWLDRFPPSCGRQSAPGLHAAQYRRRADEVPAPGFARAVDGGHDRLGLGDRLCLLRSRVRTSHAHQAATIAS